MSDTQVVDQLLHPQVGSVLDEGAVRSQLGHLAPQPTSVNIDVNTFRRLTNIANLLRTSITAAQDTAGAGEQALFLLDSIVNPHLHLDPARAAEWRLAVEPDTTDSPIDPSLAENRRATKDGKTWQERQRLRQQQYEKDMKSIAVMLKDYTTFATAKDVPWGLCRWLSTPEFAGVIVRAIKQAARLSFTRVPLPGTTTSREEASDRLVGILKRAAVLGGDKYTRTHIGRAVSEAAEWDRQVLSVSANPPRSGSSVPSRRVFSTLGSQMGSDAAGGPQQGPALKGTPAPEEEDANQGELQFSEAFSFHAIYKRLTSCALCSPSDSPEPSAARAKAKPASRAATAESGGAAGDDAESDGATADEERDTTPRNHAVHYGGMAGPSKPRAQKRKRANGGGKGGGKSGGAKVGADKKGRLLEDGDEPDNVVPDSRPASEAADDASADEDEDPAPKKGRRLDKGKGRAVSPRPTPTKDTSAASTPTFDFPMVKMSTKGVFIPENEDGRVDLSELPTCFEAPSLRCSLALITSLTASQSRALAQDRKTLGLPSFKNEDALLEQMDKRSLKRLALDLHSLAEEANMHLRNEVVSLLAVAEFQQQYIERCQAVIAEFGMPIPTMAQEQDLSPLPDHWGRDANSNRAGTEELQEGLSSRKSKAASARQVGPAPPGWKDTKGNGPARPTLGEISNITSTTATPRPRAHPSISASSPPPQTPFKVSTHVQLVSRSPRLRFDAEELMGADAAFGCSPKQRRY